jgi:hypothetical protein
MAELYSRRPMYIAAPRRGLRHWRSLAAAQGVEHFTFIAQAPINNAAFRRAGFIVESGSVREVSGAYLGRFTSAAKR